jgi:hypothetical protein
MSGVERKAAREEIADTLNAKHSDWQTGKIV